MQEKSLQNERILVKQFFDGYSLKKYSLKKWIYGNGYTQPFIAEELHLDVEEFKRKLRQREKFNREQITLLISIMKAKEAFKVIYFPTKRIRNRVWWQVFGKSREKKERTIE